MTESKKKKGYPLSIDGVVWQLAKTGEWSQHMIRRFPGYGVEVSRLYTVMVDAEGYFEICMRCLSQAIQHDVADHLWHHCTSCGLDFYFVAEFLAPPE